MERMVREAHWGYRSFTLASGETAEKGKLAFIDTANSGIVVAGKAATGLVPLGIFQESLTGDGVKTVQVKLHAELQATWWANAAGVDAVDAADRGQLCYVLDDETVTITATGHSVAGMVLDVDTSKGVLVHFGYKAW